MVRVHEAKTPSLDKHMKGKSKEGLSPHTFKIVCFHLSLSKFIIPVTKDLCRAGAHRRRWWSISCQHLYMLLLVSTPSTQICYCFSQTLTLLHKLDWKEEKKRKDTLSYRSMSPIKEGE